MTKWQLAGLTLLSMVAAVMFTSARSILMPLPLVVMTVDYFCVYYIACYVQPKHPVLFGVSVAGFAPLGYFIYQTNSSPTLWQNCILALLLALSFLLILFGNRKRTTT